MKTKMFFLTAALIFSVYSFATPPIEEGKAIFMARCSGCHNVNKIVTGPALGGVDQRHTIDWIINFVHSSQTVIKGGDKAANELFQKFNKIPMPDHPDLTADNIKSIVEYIKSQASTSADDKAPFSKPTKLHPHYLPLSLTANYSFFITYLALVALLAFALLLLVQIKSVERRKLAEKNQ